MVVFVGALIAALVGIAPTADAAPPPSVRAAGAPSVGPFKVLAGSFHDHSTDSDGDAAPTEIASWLKARHNEMGLDFLTLTDHSDTEPIAEKSANLLPWKKQAGLVQRTTGNGFSLMRGFEFTNDQQDHLNVIGSQNWVSRFTLGDATLNMLPFYTWLTTQPVVDPTGNGLGFGGADGYGQFNHPGDKGALNWDDYAYNAAAAQRMATIEIRGEQSKTAYDLMHSDGGWYWFALAKGWTVSPTMDFDWHDWHKDGAIEAGKPGKDCGVRGYLPCQRSLILAKDNSPAEIMKALGQRRTSASELPDLWATLRGPNDTWQGGTVAAKPGQTLTLTVDAGSDSQPLQSVDIVGDAGLDPVPFFEGDNAELIHSQLTPSFVVQRIKYLLFGGHATQKHKVDSPPKPAVIASVPLDGKRATKQITVRVPNTPSARPDGKHFFYAIAHAQSSVGGKGVTARAWTGPVLTQGEPIGSWIAGDGHVHNDHSSDGSSFRQGISQGMPGNNSVGDQIGQAERVGLGFLPLTDHRTYDQQWDPLWTSKKLVLVPGEEANGSPHANVLGHADELVDGANPPGSAPFRHVQQSIWDVHAQNANWSINHPDDGEWDNGFANANASAVAFDTMEVWNRGSNPDLEIDIAENRWNRGFRFGVVGGSDDHFKELWAVSSPGQPTTWVFAPERTERGVVAGLRAGHTAVNAGPGAPTVSLRADMDGDGVYEAMGGDEVTAVPGAKASLQLRVQHGAGTNVIVYSNPGRLSGPIATFHPVADDKTFVLPIDAGRSWYRVEVRGIGVPAGPLSPGNPTRSLMALTSPLFIDGGNRSAARPEISMPPVASGADNAITAMETPGSFTGFSDIAQTAQAAHVVAESDAGGHASVAYQRLASNGKTLSGAPRLLSDADVSARFPSVAANGNDVWVAWQNEPGPQTPHRTDIVVRHSADNGATWGPEQRVTTDNHAQHPTVAVTKSNHALVAWHDNVGGAFDVYAQELGVDKAATNLSAPNKKVSKGNLYDTRSAIYPASLFPSLAVASDGRVAVGWTDNRLDLDPGWTGGTHGEGTAPDDWEVFVSTKAENGKWSAPVDVSRDKFRADRHASLAFAGNGDLFAAWDSKELKESGANLDVRWAVAPGATRNWGAARTFGKDANAMSEHPQLVATPGGVKAVWYDSRSADWRWSLWSTVLSADAASPATRITGAGNATYPALSGSLVSFTSDRHATRAQRDQTEGVFVLP